MCLPIVDNMQIISQSGGLRLMALIRRWKDGGDSVLDWDILEGLADRTSLNRGGSGWWGSHANHCIDLTN